jgi:diaminohydroxyphosphoribosylaminopyrimidine deaminase/5-amino-6-(5-phosphoribosylamino)uracil reductase
MTVTKVKWTAADYRFMARAVRLAARGLYSTQPNPRVGCVLVRDDRITGEGWHEAAGGPHAEIRALEQAGAKAAGADCYVSLEPCNHHGRTPPCTEALIRAGVRRVIAAMTDPDPRMAGRGLARLQEEGIDTAHGLLEAQAAVLNRGYMRRLTQGLPLIRCKQALSLDGRTAMASGESKWITGEAARRDVQRLRARSCAVLTGIGTVLKDDPRLDVRDVTLPGQRQPLRVVLDRELRMPADARMLSIPGRTLIFSHDADNSDKHGVLKGAGAEVIILEERDFLRGVLKYLAGKEQVNEVLVEAGATLTGALLQDGLVDELILYQAPVILGDSARGLFHLPHLQNMKDRVKLTLTECRHIGGDIRLQFAVGKQ